MRRTTVVAAIAVVFGLLVLHGVAAPTGPPPPAGTSGPGPGEPGGTTGGTTPGTGSPIALETVWKDAMTFTGYEDPLYLVIRTDAEWQAFWAGGSADARFPPPVDFAKRTVLVAFFGRTPSSGYDIRITDVSALAGGTQSVSVKRAAPGSGCITLAVLTYPIHIVSIPKSDGPFEFQVDTVTYPCG